MHFWGDEWFTKNGERFYKAIDALEHRLKKWAKCGVYGKEKYGTYRDDFFRMWDGSLSVLLFGYKVSVNGLLERSVYNIDHCLIPGRKTKFGRIKYGLADFNRKIGLVSLVNRWQARQINKAVQITCREYPEFIDELLMDVSFTDLVKPCKWGNVDGKEVHDRWWTPVSLDTNLKIK